MRLPADGWSDDDRANREVMVGGISAAAWLGWTIVALVGGIFVFGIVAVYQISGDETCRWLSDEEESVRPLGFDIDGDGQLDSAGVRCDSGIATSYGLRLDQSRETSVEELVERAEAANWMVRSWSSNRVGSVRLYLDESGWERSELTIGYAVEEPDIVTYVSLSVNK